jgi:hypothetical protein
MFARLALALLLSSCGDRRADLVLALPSDTCSIAIPAGGSILYQVSAGSGSFCGGCLAVTNALTNADMTLAFLRANAPACNGVQPNATLTVSLTAFSTANCPTGMSQVYCAKSAPVKTPDGSSDAQLAVVLTCDTSCMSMTCMPTTCNALGKNCGMISDGCTGMLNCGMCTPPLKCGGHGGSGTPNVCSQ